MFETGTLWPYTPADWYWRRSDGALFSSARIATVPQNDPGYVAWAAPGRIATAWPRDTEGRETVAELQDVLGRHGLFASLGAYVAGVRFEAEVSGAIAKIGDEVVLVSTARDNRDGMRDTMLGILTGLRKDGDTLKIFADGVPRRATSAEAQVAIAAAFEHVQAAFNKEADVLAAIAAGTITTRTQVDAAFAG